MRGRVESSVAGPQRRVVGEHRRGNVDIADGGAEQLVMLDVSQQLGWRRDRCLRKTVEQPQDLGAASQLTERELSRYPRMREDDTVLEQFGEMGVAVAEVIDPDAVSARITASQSVAAGSRSAPARCRQGGRGGARSRARSVR
jgi:hypothetical protein